MYSMRFFFLVGHLLKKSIHPSTWAILGLSFFLKFAVFICDLQEISTPESLTTFMVRPAICKLEWLRKPLFFLDIKSSSDFFALFDFFPPQPVGDNYRILKISIAAIFFFFEDARQDKSNNGRVQLNGIVKRCAILCGWYHLDTYATQDAIVTTMMISHFFGGPEFVVQRWKMPLESCPDPRCTFLFVCRETYSCRFLGPYEMMREVM